MDANELFKTALGLQPPWEVTSLDFDPGKRRLDIRVDFQRGSLFPCPICGKPSKAHDTEERTWRHLDFFQHAAYLTARVPRCDCDEHGIKTVDVPWARKGSGFTLMLTGAFMAPALRVEPLVRWPSAPAPGSRDWSWSWFAK